MLQAVGPKETKACPFFRKFFFVTWLCPAHTWTRFFLVINTTWFFYVCVYAHQLIRNHSGCKELYTITLDVIITGTVIQFCILSRNCIPIYVSTMLRSFRLLFTKTRATLSGNSFRAFYGTEVKPRFSQNLGYLVTLFIYFIYLFI